MQKIITKLRYIFILSFFLLSITVSPIYAENYDVEISDNISVKYEKENDYVSVTHEYILNLNNSSYYYSPGLEIPFSLPDYSLKPLADEREYKKKSLIVTDGQGIKPSFEINETKNGLVVNIRLNRKVDKYNPYNVKLTYNTRELINKSGNISNIYIPGLPKDTKFSETDSQYNLKMKYTYLASVSLPSDMSNISYSQPKNIEKKVNDKNVIININAKDRLGKNSWLQIGDSQYYHFKIEQITPKTDNLTPKEISNIFNLVSTNVYKLAIPREYDEINQEVYIKSISPTPRNIERDGEGNLIAYFEVPANSESLITIEGYIKQSNKNSREIKDMDIQAYLNNVATIPNYSNYISEGKYWEISNEKIIEISNNISNKVEDKTILNLLNANYDYIVDNFDYSYEKLKDNKRLGAYKALTGSPAVCMEYSDAITALFRTQKIPTRIAIGYGNDPTGAEGKISSNELKKLEIGHQWNQVWIPDYGWMTVDPTWAEAGREYIGSDLDHILLYTVSTDKDNVYDTGLFTADNKNNIDLSNYSFYIQALTEDQFNKIDNIQPINTFLNENENKIDDIVFLLQTNMIGRFIVYIIPAVLTFTIVPIIITTLFGLLKKILRK